MKTSVLLLFSVIAFQSLRAEALSDADRETLLENLDKLRDSVDSKMDARFRMAVAAFRNAMTSDEAAIDLYLNCTEKVKFADQQKSSGDFREWKRKEDEELSDPALRLALRHQLRWLVLTLQAASEKPDRAKLAADAQNIVDAIFSDPEKLSGQEKILGQSVTASVFAQAYDINSVEVEKWPMSPVQLERIYEDILLPPYRNPATLTQLRSGWIKRIQQEGAKVEHMAAEKKRREPANGKDDREEKRIGMASAMRPPEYEKFLEETAPELQWEMEMDLFKHGDQSGAAVRMLAHMEKHITHASVKKWGEDFRKLLAPAAPETAAATEAPAQ